MAAAEGGEDPDEQPGGGFDPDFLTDPLQSFFECPLCLAAMCCAVQSSVCGHQFCKSCLEKVFRASRQQDGCLCPVCKKELRKQMIFPDIALNRRILDLKTRCPNGGDQCKWKGELREVQEHRLLCPDQLVKCPNDHCQQMMKRTLVDRHRKDDCLHQLVECDTCKYAKFSFWGYSVSAGRQVERMNMEKHKKNHCPGREITCDACKKQVIFGRLKDHHEERCLFTYVKCEFCRFVTHRRLLDKHCSVESGDCPKAIVPCPFALHGVDCKYKCERRLMSTHLADAVVAHQLLLAKGLQSGLRMVAEERKDRNTKAELAFQNLEDDWKMVWEPHDKDQSREEVDLLGWLTSSEPVYSGPCGTGYTFAVRVLFCDPVYLFIQAIPGAFDDCLQWPYKGHIKITAVRQKGTGGDEVYELHREEEESRQYLSRPEPMSLDEIGYASYSRKCVGAGFTPEDRLDDFLVDGTLKVLVELDWS